MFSFFPEDERHLAVSATLVDRPSDCWTIYVNVCTYTEECMEREI